MNINLNRESVKELVCANLDIAKATEELRSILKGGSQRERMLNDFAELAQMMGGDGASRRFAKDIVNSLNR